MVQPHNILVTGAAGFIGWKVCEFLLTKPDLIPQINNATTGASDNKTTKSSNNKTMRLSNHPTIIGIDNLNDYYDIRLKQWRLEQLIRVNSCDNSRRFVFEKADIESYKALRKLFQKYAHPPSPEKPSPLMEEGKGEGVSNPPFVAIINLAARAGVRYSLENPFVYYTTNIIGNLNLLELCREFGVKKYILASSSSLYAGQKMPFKENLPVNELISPYAVSKKSAELTCYTYHKLYNIDVTILRYFTVYGPASRPDMSPLRFISWVAQEKPVIIYGDGTQSRDFTYVDDIARGTIMGLKPSGFEIINLGSDKPYKLIDFLHIIEEKVSKKARIAYEQFHPADMKATWADITKAKKILGWQPEVKLEQGIAYAVDWFIKNKSWATKIRF